VSVELDQLSQFLFGRCNAIAEQWQKAIAPTDFVPLSAIQVRQRMAELTRQAITLLLTEPFDPAPAQSIGRSLAQLHPIQPETLQKTQLVLGTQLVEGLPADQAAALYPRLIALLGELATGFFGQAREILLDEQEQIRRALAAERQRAAEEVRELNKTLVRRVMDRTEQLTTSNEDLQREIAARKQILETLQDTTQALQTLIYASPLAIIVIDPLGNVRTWNPAAERTFGWTAAEVVGRPLPIIPEDRQVEFQSMREAAKQRNGFSDVEVRRLKKDGALIDVSISSAALRDAHGKLTGFMAIIADITARKQAEETLRQYASELQARNEELDAFAHTVAHDLNNPLTNLVGYADVLRVDYAEMSDEERQVCVNSILQSGQKMSNIIDELLLLAGVRQTQVEIKPLDMAGIVAEACRRLSYMLNRWQVKVVLPAASEWPVGVGYAPWIEEVWVNYISNALKYGGKPPRVEVGGEANPDGTVRFWVRDNGNGLTPEQQARLFAPFTQLNQVRAEGYGLGLSIVRRIVEKLHGQVGVESSGISGEGSLFYFTLPIG
jgi:PAS domain S-box-containing protein